MAAVLCSTFGNLCEDCCHCLTLPCRACCDLACSPFVPYIAVTLILNIPLVVWGLQTFSDGVAACDKVWWLWGNAIMAFIHIAASFYISNRIQNDKESHGDNFHPTGATVPYGAPASGAPPTMVVTTTALPLTTPTNEALTGVKNSSTDPYATKAASATVATTTPNQNTGNPFLDMYNKVSSATKADGTMVATNGTPTLQQQQEYVQATKVEAMTHPVTPYTNVNQHAQYRADDDGPAMSWQRLSRVLCYDAGVAIYILVVVAWVIWQTIGVTSLISLAGAEDDGTDCGSVKRWIVLSTMCGWIYMMVVFCAFGCSLICLR